MLHAESVKVSYFLHHQVPIFKNDKVRRWGLHRLRGIGLMIEKRLLILGGKCPNHY